MSKYLPSTIAAMEFCKHCKAITMHEVINGRLGRCEKCWQRLADEQQKKNDIINARVDLQEKLF